MLGKLITVLTLFKCSLDHENLHSTWTVNNILGKIGRIASEEVILQLIQGKCMPIMVLKPLLSKKRTFRSLDFIIDRFFMKLFRTTNMDTDVVLFSFYLLYQLMVNKDYHTVPSEVCSSVDI